jgi:flavin reductase (DIM6/NTAB) family NADH-FMN oxidoreductase RutF
MFDPASDARAFRGVLGRYATGVCVITCAGPDGPVGMTANSFASISLDPPLVLWSPARASARAPAFLAAERYAIHVLGAGQRALAEAFARDGRAFGSLDWAMERGAPLIEGCLARLECARHAVHEAGDHHMILGRVTRAQGRPGPALVFAGGTYGRVETG